MLSLSENCSIGTGKSVVVSNDFLNAVRSYYSAQISRITPRWENILAQITSPKRVDSRLDDVSRYLGIDLVNKKILEIGSGFGMFVAVALEKGLDCCGVEPNEYFYKASARLLKDSGLRTSIYQARGEELPFEDNAFDLVVSFQVLEHSQDPKKVLDESIRVLRKGGFLYFAMPNFASFWEGHYGLPWIPLLPKRLAKLYVRLLGRDPSFLEHLWYLTPKRVAGLLAEERRIRIIDLGQKTWDHRLSSFVFPMWGQTRKLLPFATVMRRTGLLPIVKNLGKRFDFYYPIILMAQKEKN